MAVNKLDVSTNQTKRNFCSQQKLSVDCKNAYYRHDL